MAAGDITAVRSEASDGYSAASFDGVDDRVNLPLFSTIGDISISVWFYARGNGGGNLGRILDSNKISFMRVADERMLLTRDGGASEPVSFDDWHLGRWYNCIVTSTAAGVTNFYKNGVLSGNANQDAGTPTEATALYIGNSASLARCWNGMLKDLKFYNKILSAAEITSLAAGLDIDRTNLVGEWKLQDNYLDTSGHGNHGTNSGTFLTNTLTNKIKADMQGMNLPAATDKIIALPRRGSPTIVAAKRTP